MSKKTRWCDMSVNERTSDMLKLLEMYKEDPSQFPIKMRDSLAKLNEVMSMPLLPSTNPIINAEAARAYKPKPEDFIRK